MKQFALLLSAILLASATFSQHYEANWASLDKRKIPEWFHQDKFGIFIHWGLYSVPAYAPVIPNSGISYAEWYWHSLTENQKDFRAFHNKTYGDRFSYAQFEPMFKAELFNPQQWAEVFKKSGAKYVVLTSKHHEGYCLWNSPEADRDWGRPWNAVTGTPKRDLLGDLTNAVRDAGLKMGYYYSLYEWYNPLWQQKDKSQYVDQHMTPQFKDLVTRYKPSIIFSDGEWELSDTAWKSEKLLAWLFNESPVAKDVVVDDRWGSNTRGKHSSTYTTSEYGSGMDATVTWEESQGIGHSYGYNRNEQLDDYKSSTNLILMLVDIVSRGGNLLLDIGPTADGSIPVIMQQRLLDMGHWLAINGEAIYGTTSYKHSYQWSEGKMPEKKSASFMANYSITEMIRPKQSQAHVEAFFTRKDKNLYCIIPGYQKQVRIRNLKGGPAIKASILGYNKAVKIKQSGNDWVIDLSGITPGEISSDLFTIKLANAL